MICCLLAWLAALPGLALMRRMRPRQTWGHCMAIRSGSPGKDVMLAMAAAGAVVAVPAVVLTLHNQTAGAAWHPLGPICATLDRITFNH